MTSQTSPSPVFPAPASLVVNLPTRQALPAARAASPPPSPAQAATADARGLPPTPVDRIVLHRLAEHVAEAASSPRMQRTRELWRRHNQLEPTRPLVFCDPENGWGEIIPNSVLQCSSPIARGWEHHLRREVFWANAMGDDKPVEIYFDVPYVVVREDWGLTASFQKTHANGSYTWDSPLKDYRTDLPKLRVPHIEVDLDATCAWRDLARDIFGDLLCVRVRGQWWWSLGLTQRAVHLRGMEQLHYDFVDHPDEVKELMRRLSEGTLAKLDYLESNGLLSLNNEGVYVGSGGFGFTDELPQPDFDGRVRCRDLWGFADSQETAHISPEMYEEFVFPYERPILERFGLNCYGCCEPLHARWHVVRRHHALRRVSCSPWTDVRTMAEQLGDRHILSLKPNPAPLATPNFDEEAIRQGLREALDVTKGCVVEIIMKDNHTLANCPNHVVRWCEIARQEAARAVGE